MMLAILRSRFHLVRFGRRRGGAAAAFLLEIGVEFISITNLCGSQTSNFVGISIQMK